MIRARGEEDKSVWSRLKGNELEVAKQMLLDNLGHDCAYMDAISIFKDERGIPLLKKCLETLDDKYCYERLKSAKILYDWMGYSKYLELLDLTIQNCGKWTKLNLDYWIDGIPSDLAKRYIILMLKDEDEFVRFSAYNTLKKYLKLGDATVEENKYYTSETIYNNKELFNSRLSKLETKINF